MGPRFGEITRNMWAKKDLDFPPGSIHDGARTNFQRRFGTNTTLENG